MCRLARAVFHRSVQLPRLPSGGEGCEAPKQAAAIGEAEDQQPGAARLGSELTEAQ